MNIQAMLFIPFCLLVAAAQAQQGSSFTLKGTTGEAMLDSVSLEYVTEGKYIHLVAPAANGSFTLQGPMNQATFSVILFKYKGEQLTRNEWDLKKRQVYLQPGQLAINALAGPREPLIIRGSTAQADWNELQVKTQPLVSAIDSLSRGLAHGADNPQQAAINGLQAQLAQANYAFFREHPHSFITADRVKFFMNAYSLDSIKTIYNNLGPELKETVAGKMLALNIRSKEVGLPGSMAADFTVKDREGKEVSLAAFRGKYVLLDFWATWCVPCRASMPHMISIYQKYKDRNFDMIGIGDDDRTADKWKAAIDKDGTGIWHQVLRGMDIELTRSGRPNPRDLSELYGIHALPTKILVDPNGKIIGRFTGSEQHGSDPDMDKMLEQVFTPVSGTN